MAPTRLTARLLDHAAQAGAKVIAIGDSGQLPSVLAGGWLRAVGERIGALELTEVMRQRDPGERRALGALHDGRARPLHRLGDARTAGSTSSPRIGAIAEQAVSEWIAAAAEHAPGQAVMIARDNETRARLNDARSRAPRRGRRARLRSTRTAARRSRSATASSAATTTLASASTTAHAERFATSTARRSCSRPTAARCASCPRATSRITSSTRTA